MKVIVGTTNKGKIQAVRQAFLYYPQYQDVVISGSSVSSGVSDQPIGLEEIITGAKNRARLAFDSIISENKLGIGLESGIFPVPHTKSDYMDTTACAIYDGASYHIGLSSCFEYPKKMIQKILSEGKDVSKVALELGLFEGDDSFREREGVVGLLTKGSVSRIFYSTQAVHMALVHLLNEEHYN